MARFILSRKVTLEQYQKVEQLADIVSYSSKTNPDVTRVLEAETDCMFSVHTENELKHIKDRSRVIFLAQAWNHEQIARLQQQGIRWFVVDNESDLKTILEYQKNATDKIHLLLRFKLKENTIRTEKYYVFGMPSEMIIKRVKEIQKDPVLSKNTFLGIHFHRKTQNMSEWNIRYELEHTFPDDFWQHIDVANIGGGLPSVYANTNADVIGSVFEKIRQLNAWLSSHQIRTIVEPGRFIAAPAVRLESEIIGIHGNTIIVNTSVYSGDLDALVVPVKLLVEGELPRGQGQNYVIKGVTPCSMDIYRYRVYLPEQQVGDTIVFLNAGAYNFASDFCDLDAIPTEVVE